MFGPFREVVDSILAAGESAPRKQLHTAQQVYRRLITEYGYTGGYDQVRSTTDRADRGGPARPGRSVRVVRVRAG